MVGGKVTAAGTTNLPTSEIMSTATIRLGVRLQDVQGRLKTAVELGAADQATNGRGSGMTHASSPAFWPVAEPVTIKGWAFNIEYGEPDLRIAVDHIKVGNRHFDACERQTTAGWVLIDCKTGREVGSSRQTT